MERPAGIRDASGTAGDTGGGHWVADYVAGLWPSYVSSPSGTFGLTDQLPKSVQGFLRLFRCWPGETHINGRIYVGPLLRRQGKSL